MMPLAEAAALARRLGWLLSKGASLPEALVQAQAQNQPATDALKPVLAEVVAGASLAQALRRGGQAFPPLFTAGIVEGADPGQALAEVARLLEATREQQSDLEAALAYPRFLLVMLGLLSLLAFAWMGSGINPEQRHHPIGLVLMLAGLMAVYWLLSNAPSADSWRWRLPILGSWLQQRDAAGLLTWLEHLLPLGLPLDEALRLAASGAQSAAFRASLNDAAQLVQRGSSLSQALAGRLPELAVWMVARAEGLGFPPDHLAGTARLLNRELKLASRRGLELLGPVLLLGLGLAILVCALLVLGPLYQQIGFLH